VHIDCDRRRTIHHLKRVIDVHHQSNLASAAIRNVAVDPAERFD
jgi:hypothetical protein